MRLKTKTRRDLAQGRADSSRHGSLLSDSASLVDLERTGDGLVTVAQCVDGTSGGLA